MNRESVLQTVRAAGVFSDVAADRANLLTRRIGSVVEAVRRHRPRDVEIDDARLDGDPLIRDVDVEDPVQARQRDQDPAGNRQRTAGETGAMAPRDERDAVAMAAADDRLHVDGGSREQDEARPFAQPCEGVRFVRDELVLVADDDVRREELFEIRNERRVHMVIVP